jgi:hypothetical protein
LAEKGKDTLVVFDTGFQPSSVFPTDATSGYV